MTAKEALKLSIILWNWLVDHPGNIKHDCPLVPVEEWACHCPLCEYDLKMGKNDCSICPMLKRWPTPINSGPRRCFATGTAFIAWSYLVESEYASKNYYDGAFFALLLLEAFERRYEEL